MIHETIKLTDKYPEAELEVYVHDESSDPRPAIVVCPGGGYHFTSEREACPIAEFYYNAGMNAYILYYSVAQNATDYRPLAEVSFAVKYVRENSEKHNNAPNKIITCGFSAGGHLAASAGILWNTPMVRDAVGITDGSAPEGINRPDGMILSYPVITAGKYAHRGSFANLIGKQDYTEEDVKYLSLEKNVDKTVPPMFIWHTSTDTCVPVQNSLLLVNAFVENSIPFEAHIYPFGPHGMSLATQLTCGGNSELVDSHVATWSELSVMWIKDMFK